MARLGSTKHYEDHGNAGIGGYMAFGDAFQEEEQRVLALSNTANFRDTLFEENQGMAVKTIGGVVIGVYLIYRFLIK